MPSGLIRVLAIAAIVVVLVPTCAMAVGAMEMDLVSMLTCDSMWFASDAESGIILATFVFALLVAFTTFMISRYTVESGFLVLDAGISPLRPPDDPLVGRLII